ncbi:MAG: AAA family ATPase [Gaiellales bacterium]
MSLPVRCLMVSRDASLVAAVQAIADQSTTLRVVGTAPARRVLTGSPPGADVLLVAHEAGQDGPGAVRDLTSAWALPAVILASAPDLELYRAALAAGARGVVALPVSRESLATAVSDALRGAAVQGRRHDADGQVIAVCSGKGGVGCTAVAVVLAAAGGGLLGDLSGGFASLAELVGCEHERSVADLGRLGQLLDRAAIEAVAVPRADGLRLLPGVADPELLALLPDGAGGALVRELRGTAPLSVVDLGVPATHVAREVVTACDRVLVVVSPDVYAVRGGRGLIDALVRSDVGIGSISAVVNRWSRASELSLGAVRRALGVPVAAVVGDDARAASAFANGRDPNGRWAGRRSMRPLVRLSGELVAT